MKIILASLLYFISIALVKGQLIEINEVISYNKKIPLSDLNIVDINGSLELKIDRKTLTYVLAGDKTENLELTSALDKYDEILIFQNSIIEVIQQETNSLTQQARIEKLGLLAQDVLTLTSLINEYGLEDKFNAYSAEYFELSSFQREKYYNYHIAYGLQQLGNEQVEEITQLKNQIDKEQISIQLTAFLNTRKQQNIKVHVENFDQYSAGEFYEVERWATSFSEEDIEAFNETARIANTLNQNLQQVEKNIIELLENNLRSVTCIESSLKETVKLIKKKDRYFKDKLTEATEFLEEVEYDFEELLSILEMIKGSQSNKNVLEIFNEAQSKFIDKVNAIPKKYSSIISQFSASFLADHQDFDTYIDEFNTCLSSIEDDAKTIRQLATFTYSLLAPIRESTNGVITIGEGVNSFGIQDIPEFGYIDLKTTGKRENRDQLVIRLVIRNQDDIDNERVGTVLEKRELSLQQIKVHSISNISMILASPLGENNDNVNLENDFQFAPAGYLLFKFGTRNNKFLNFMDPGIGFSLSTPDFDLDGTPDVGVGGACTFLRDVLSLGMSYNTKTDTPYWYFGLSLPFSTLGLPINTVKTDQN